MTSKPLDEGVPVPVKIDNGDGTYSIVMLTPGPRIVVETPAQQASRRKEQR